MSLGGTSESKLRHDDGIRRELVVGSNNVVLEVGVYKVDSANKIGTINQLRLTAGTVPMLFDTIIQNPYQFSIRFR